MTSQPQLDIVLNLKEYDNFKILQNNLNSISNLILLNMHPVARVATAMKLCTGLSGLLKHSLMFHFNL